MKKLNNKGFVLAETLVVSVFILSIFTLIFINFYPLIGQYEKREFYDDIDSKYDIYWFKRLVQNPKVFSPSCQCISNINNGSKSYEIIVKRENNGAITCDDCFGKFQVLCQKYAANTELDKLYLTSYHLANTTKNTTTNDILKGKRHLKDDINRLNDEDLKDYINYLPDYEYDSINGNKYRLIAEYKRNYNSGEFKSFSTVEVGIE